MSGKLVETETGGIPVVRRWITARDASRFESKQKDMKARNGENGCT